MEPESSLPYSQAPATISPMSISKHCFSRGGVVSTSPNPKAGGAPLVGRPRLLIQFIRSYPSYWRPFLHPQPEDALCHCDRDPQTRYIYIYIYTYIQLPSTITVCTRVTKTDHLTLFKAMARVHCTSRTKYINTQYGPNAETLSQIGGTCCNHLILVF